MACPNSCRFCSAIWDLIKRNILMVTTILAVILGFLFGIIIRMTSPTDDAILWIGMPGDVFIRLLKLTILPLIAANVIVVTSTLDAKENGKISIVAFAFIITSNIVASLSGVFACLLLTPGGAFNSNMTASNHSGNNFNSLKTSDIFADLIYNLFPDNLIGVSIFQTRTTYEIISSKVEENSTIILNRKLSNVSSINMLGLLFCSFTFGIAAGKAGDQGKAFLEFFKSVAAIVFRIMNVFLWLTPVGVFFMIAGSIAAIKDLSGTFSQLSLFVATICAGLASHMFFMLMGYTVITRVNPFRLVPYWFRTWLISFTTLSPMVAIPEMYSSCDRYGIDPSLSRFVVPLSAALKGDGSAVFISASSLFIAQMNNIEVTTGTTVIVCLLSASAVLALPNIPSSSIVIIITILSSLGIPTNLVVLLYAMEWLLDRLRTSNLAILHMYCVAFTHYVCRGGRNSTERGVDRSMKVHTSVSKGDAMLEEASCIVNNEIGFSERKSIA